MKIAILGGAFDPPHLDHQLMAEQVLDFAPIDEVWLTPCYRHTFNKKMTPVSHRVKMTKILINQKIKYCGEEIANKLSGNSIDLLEILQKKYSQHQFFFIIGSDQLPNFKKWGRWKKLITSFDFLVFPRSDFVDSLAKFGLDNPGYKFHPLTHPLLITTNISSTNIRQRVKNKLAIKNLVPPKVEEYIIENKLYI